MERNEILKEVAAIKTDLREGKVTITEVLQMLENFSKSINVDFSVLYNMFYSSNPEIYLS